jgi:hypothetical protein
MPLKSSTSIWSERFRTLSSVAARFCASVTLFVLLLNSSIEDRLYVVVPAFPGPLITDANEDGGTIKDVAFVRAFV